MAASSKDHWSSEAYQHSASFVPKLATKVLGWLDPQKDDVILDIGCGDCKQGPEICQVLAQGKGSLHGIDSSPAMIKAAQKAHEDAGIKCASFEVVDALDLPSKPELQKAQFTKVFSNAAMHWILRPPARRADLFRGVRDALAPGGVFVFEMGGLGNVSEIRAALLAAVGRRLPGGPRHVENAVSPWFFPDEEWARATMEDEVCGLRVERIEREWRPTTADAGGVEGWVRLMAAQFFEALPEAEREPCIREVLDVLEIVCAKPGGGYMFSYVRLRAIVRKI